MNELWLQFYHSLPAPLRSVVASARGWQLRSWRYGPETERLVQEALAREAWSAKDWRGWKQKRLTEILHRAATRVPYYREYWKQHGAGNRQLRGTAPWEILSNWPVLEKEQIRANPRAFLAEDCAARRLTLASTSGTSGKPLAVWFSRETLRAWYALFEARCRRWYGLSRQDRWAILGGQLVAPVSQHTPPFWVWNAPLNQLYMSTFHLTPDSIPAYLDALLKYRIRHLWGYTSSLRVLAEEAMRLRRRDVKMDVVVTNAEPLSSEQRAVIGRAFQCPVRETYGMTEKVTGASECECGSLHLWPEAGVVEVLADDRDAAVSPGVVGRIVCTGLLNREMPLIRYAVGDRGSFALADYECPCKRTLPVLARLEGRTTDLLFTPDGGRVYWLNPVFTGMPVRESQIVQEAIDRVVVRYVPAPDFSDEAAHTIARRLQQRLGVIRVDFEPVKEIPRGPNGKFRAVVCNLSATEKERLQPRLV